MTRTPTIKLNKAPDQDRLARIIFEILGKERGVKIEISKVEPMGGGRLQPQGSGSAEAS